MAAVRNAVMEKLKRFQRRGDPKADDAARRIVTLLGIDIETDAGIDALERLMNGLSKWRPGEALPDDVPAAAIDSIMDFVVRDDALPEWFDPKVHGLAVLSAQDMFQKRKMTSWLILGCASLPYCYSHHEVATTLHGTGNLLSEVRKRLKHTGAFVDAVMTPHSLMPGQPGLAWARKIRLMHGLMRQLTIHKLQRPDIVRKRAPSAVTSLLARDWRRETGEMPLDQVELCFVLLTFSFVMLEGWESLGLKLDRNDRNNYTFAWAIVGHMLGIDPELLTRDPATADREARELFAGIRAMESMDELYKPKLQEHGRMLSAVLLVLLMQVMLSDASDGVLLSGLPERWKRWIARGLPRTLVRRLVGKRTARELWLDPAPLRERIFHYILIRWVGLPKVLARAGPGAESGLWCDYGEELAQACGMLPASSAS